MIRWLNPKNGDLSPLAAVATATATVLVGGACWLRLHGVGADNDLQFGAAICGAMMPAAWSLRPVSIFKNRAERVGYLALCVGITIVVLVFLAVPEVFA